MLRPRVDVVVPYCGDRAGLEGVRRHLQGLRLREGDSIVVVDNTPTSASCEDGPIPVLHAADLPTPGFARNQGARAGENEWLVFLDADVVAPPDLVDRYFALPPEPTTALIGGAVIDEPVPGRGMAVARHAYLRRHMSQHHSLELGEWSYPKTVNVACRRVAFNQVGGFREDIRAGEDADFAYRIKAAGWQIETRDAATVVHRSRQTVRGFIAQKAVHGAGGAWLDREYPGSVPARRRPGLVWWGMRTTTKGLVAAIRTRDRDRAIVAVFEPLELLAFEFGRSLSNQRRRRGTSRRTVCR